MQWTDSTGTVIRPTITTTTAGPLSRDVLAGRLEIRQIGLTRSWLMRHVDAQGATIRRVSDALSGAHAGVAAKCLVAARRKGGHLSRPLLGILSHGGCDAAAWIVMRPHVDEIRLPGPDGGRTVTCEGYRGDETVRDTHAMIADGVHWMRNGDIDIATALPEAAIVRAVGRPLREILSHPALDPVPLRVTGVDDNGGGGHVIHTDIAQLPLAVAAIDVRALGPANIHASRLAA